MLALSPDHPSLLHERWDYRYVPLCSASDPSSCFTSLKKHLLFFCVCMCVCWYTPQLEKGIGAGVTGRCKLLDIHAGNQIQVLEQPQTLFIYKWHLSVLLYYTKQSRDSCGAHRWPRLVPPLTFLPSAVLKDSLFCYSNFIGSALTFVYLTHI